MKAFSSYNQSLWYLLTHSLITLGSLLLLSALFFYFQYNIVSNGIPDDKMLKASLLLSLVLNGFLGIYLGGALSIFQSSYLWSINRKYKYTLISAFLTLIFVFSAAPLLYSLVLGGSLQLLSVLPFCISLFTAQIVLQKKMFQRVGLFLFPFLLLQLYRLGFNELMLMNIIIAATVLLIISMYKMGTYKKVSAAEVTQSEAYGHTAVNSTIIGKANFFIGNQLSVWIKSSTNDSNKNIDWAIFLPQSKLFFGTFLNLAILTFFVTISSSADKLPLGEFALLFASMSMLGIIMESRNLVKQLKSVAHVFGGENHRHMKTKILNRLGLLVSQSNILFMIVVLLLGSIFSLKVSTEFLVLALISVTIITLSLLPLLMSVNWNKVYVALVLICAVFAYSILSVTSWLGTNLIKEGVEGLVSIEVLLFFVVCIVVRIMAQKFYWNRPIEKLFKNT